MKLILEEEKPVNTIYSTEDGRMMYKIDDTTKWGGLGKHTTVIQKLDASSGSWVTFGSVEHRDFHSDKLIMGDWQVEANDFFRKKGMGFYGRNRIFTAPDGKEYSWEMGSSICELSLNDESKTKVTKYTRKYYGIFHDKAPASLEILPPGQHMLDFVMFTFAYVESLRTQEEKQTIKSVNSALKP